MLFYIWSHQIWVQSVHQWEVETRIRRVTLIWAEKTHAVKCDLNPLNNESQKISFVLVQRWKLNVFPMAVKLCSPRRAASPAPPKTVWSSVNKLEVKKRSECCVCNFSSSYVWHSCLRRQTCSSRSSLRSLNKTRYGNLLLTPPLTDPLSLFGSTV